MRLMGLLLLLLLSTGDLGLQRVVDPNNELWPLVWTKMFSDVKRSVLTRRALIDKAVDCTISMAGLVVAEECYTSTAG